MRVIVTRPRAQADELARRIEALGHEVVLCPVTAIEPLGDEPVDPSGYDWLVVTSPNGANELARRLTAKPTHVAAIGPGTAATLRSHGIEPTLVPRVSTQEGLLADLPRPAGRVLFAGAEGARRVLVEELGADLLPLYRTVDLVPEELPSGDIVVLASASAARAWSRLGIGVPAISIGPQTTKAAHEAGIEVALEADPHDMEGLVEALRRLG